MFPAILAAPALPPSAPHSVTVPPPSTPCRRADREGENTSRRAARTSVPFTQVPTEVLRAAGLPPGTRLLYSLLCAYQGQAATCWPPQARLAQHLSPTTTVRTVQRLLRPLRDSGWITVQRVGTRQVYACDVPLHPGGFVQIPTCVLKAAYLSSGARLLYGLLLSYRGRAGTYPGQTRLAADLGVTSTRTVRRLLTELATTGYLTWTRAGRGQANRYHLHIPPTAHNLPLERTARSPLTSHPARLTPSVPNPGTTAGSATDATAVSTKPDSQKPESKETVLSKRPTAHSFTQQSVPVRQQLRAYVADLARELGDEASLAASLSRTYNLFAGSGLPLDAFLARFQEARRVTQQRTAQVQKHRQEAAVKNKMPYFFAVLAERLSGAAPQADPPVTPHAPTMRPATPVRRAVSPPPPTPRTDAGHIPVVAAPAPPYSPLIAGAVLDLAQALQDGLAGPGAVSPALHLWQQSGWSEAVFVAALQGAGVARRRRLDEVLHALAQRIAATDSPDLPVSAGAGVGGGIGQCLHAGGEVRRTGRLLARHTNCATRPARHHSGHAAGSCRN